MPEIDPAVQEAIDAAGASGTTAWVLASAALVLFMTPGLAFFYGGMTRSKSVLNMLMMSFSAIGVVSVLWVLYGYSLAFSGDVGGAGADQRHREVAPQQRHRGVLEVHPGLRQRRGGGGDDARAVLADDGDR